MARKRELLTLNLNDLARSNGLDAGEACGHEQQQVFQTVRLHAENDNCDLAGSQVLLVFDALIQPTRACGWRTLTRSTGSAWPSG